MLECKFTTQDHRCPWVSASSNNRLGSSIWAAIISARYCFVYFGSRMETLFYISPGGESSSSKRGSDVVLVTIQNLPVLMTTGYPISFPSVLKMWFFGMQAVSGRISRQKRLCVVRPALGAYISGTRLVRGTYSLGRLELDESPVPLEGWVSIS